VLVEPVVEVLVEPVVVVLVVVVADVVVVVDVVVVPSPPAPPPPPPQPAALHSAPPETTAIAPARIHRSFIARGYTDSIRTEVSSEIACNVKRLSTWAKSSVYRPSRFAPAKRGWRCAATAESPARASA
jgi:hypothetical protein